MKVQTTSDGVILIVFNLDELLSLNGVKYYENPITKLSSEIYEIKVDGKLEIDENERAYMDSLSDSTISFDPETYDITLYGKAIGNLGLNAYDMPYGNINRYTLIKVNLNYPEAEKIDDSDCSAKDVLWNGKNQFASFECPNLEEIPTEGFFCAPNLTSFSSENVKSFGNYAFYRSNLYKIYAPNVETIGELAFGDTTISEVDFPKVKMLHVSSEDNTPFLHCPLSSFKMDGLKYCINEEDNWFWNMDPSQRYAWMRNNGYIYSPGALATAYKEIEYLKGFNPLYQTSGLKKLSLKSYNCGTPEQGDFDYDTEYVYYPVSRDLISGDYLNDVEELNIQSMEKIPSHFAEKLTNVKDVVFNKNLKCVFDSGFEGSELLSGVLSFDKLEYIGKRAFANCKNITKVVLPADVETIDSEAFADCDNLEKVEGAARVSFFGRRASDEKNVATNIFVGTNVRDFYYDDTSYNPVQYKENIADDDPPAVDIFGKDLLLHLRSKEEYQPLPNEVSGIVIHPFIGQISPFVSYLLKKGEEFHRNIDVAVNQDVYADYLLKCQNNPHNPGFDPSFSETMATIQTAEAIIQRIDAGETVTDAERNIAAHKDELQSFADSMEYVRTHFDKFVASTADGISIFDLSAVTTPTVISFGKNKISQFEANKSEFFDFMPSFIESWEIDPPTAPEIEIEKIYDNDFQNETVNFDFVVHSAGRKSEKVVLSAFARDYETDEIVWSAKITNDAVIEQKYSINATGHKSGNQYEIYLIGTNNNGLTTEARRTYKATAFSKGCISYVKVMPRNSTTIDVVFKLEKLPTDANGQQFNPNVDVFIQSTDKKVDKKITVSSVDLTERTVRFTGILNDKTYDIKVVEKGKSEIHDVSHTMRIKHRITRKLVFASSGHYQGLPWQFKQSQGAVTKEVVVGVPYYFRSSTYGYSISQYTTIFGFTRTKNSYKAEYKDNTAITLNDSSPSTITFYPVPGMVSVTCNKSQRLYIRTMTNERSSATAHGNFSFPAIQTCLPGIRTWYADRLEINVLGTRSAASGWFEFRDDNNGSKDVLSTGLGSVSGNKIAVRSNSDGCIRLWGAGRLYAVRRKPVEADVTAEFRIRNRFYTYINK